MFFRNNRNKDTDEPVRVLSNAELRQRSAHDDYIRTKQEKDDQAKRDRRFKNNQLNLDILKMYVIPIFAAAGIVAYLYIEVRITHDYERLSSYAIALITGLGGFWLRGQGNKNE